MSSYEAVVRKRLHMKLIDSRQRPLLDPENGKVQLDAVQRAASAYRLHVAPCARATNRGSMQRLQTERFLALETDRSWMFR